MYNSNPRAFIDTDLCTILFVVFGIIPYGAGKGLINPSLFQIPVSWDLQKIYVSYSDS